MAESTPDNAAVPGHGAVRVVPQTTERPDKSMRYQVVFSVTQPAPDAASVNPSLEKVARFLNLLAGEGIRPKPGDIVAVIHGKATTAALNDGKYRQRNNGAANPNLDLIAQLRAAGAEVHVCSQALAGQKIPVEDVDKRVQIDLAALTTLATLQLRDYAMITD